MIRSALTVVRILAVLLMVLLPAAVRSEESQQQTQEKTPSSAPTSTVPGYEEGSLQGKPAENQIQKPEEAKPVQGTLIVPEHGEPAEPEQKAESEQQEPKTAVSKEAEQVYVIKRGDTLWDISNAFLKDPFLWPFIWKANPYISNPDLIYPGNKLVIPSLAPIERAMEAPEKTGQEQRTVTEKVPSETPAPLIPFKKRSVKTAPTETTEEEKHASKLILPEETPVPIMDKYSMLNAGFVSIEESDDRIVGTLEGKTIFGYDDIVYVSIKSTKDAAVGDKFIMYQPLERVKHPVTGRNYGRLIKVLGILQLVEKGLGSTFTARVTLSFDAADSKTLLTPYQEPMLIYNNAQAKAKDISGYILEVVDGRTINAQTDIVYLDKGSVDGVEPGDRFLVYARSAGKKSYPRTLIGEAQVFLVKPRTCTAVVRKSSDTLEKGDPVMSRR